MSNPLKLACCRGLLGAGMLFSGGLVSFAGCAGTPVETEAPESTLKVQMSGDKYRSVGKPLHYQLTVDNRAPRVAEDVELRDWIPVGNDFVEASDGGRLEGRSVVWFLGDLQPNETRTVTLTLIQTSRRAAVHNTLRAVARSGVTPRR